MIGQRLIGPAPTRADRLRGVLNWVNLSTPLGLAVARLGGARIVGRAHGCYLADGYRPRLPIAPAFTIGDVLVSRRPWLENQAQRPALLGHETAHSWQYLATGGLPFFVAYGAAAAWSWSRTGHPGARNVFEQWAGLRRGGYPVRVPTRRPTLPPRRG